MDLIDSEPLNVTGKLQKGNTLYEKMDGDIFDRLVSAERNLFSEKQFSYGTAGFRDKY